MITFLFLICMIWIFGKLFLFALKAAWGISKILLTVVLLPLALVFLVFAGLIYTAFPVLLVAGLISFAASRA